MRKRRKILSEAQRLEIIRRYITHNIPADELAIYYNVSLRTIRNIVKGYYRYPAYRDFKSIAPYDKIERNYREYDHDSGEPDDPNDFWRRENYRDISYDDKILIIPNRVPHNRHEAIKQFSIDYNGDFKDE